MIIRFWIVGLACLLAWTWARLPESAAAPKDTGGKEPNLGWVDIPDKGGPLASFQTHVLEQKLLSQDDPAFEPLVRYVAEFTFPAPPDGFRFLQTALVKAQAGLPLLNAELEGLRAAKAPPAWIAGLQKPLAWSLVYANVRDEVGLARRVGSVLTETYAVVEPTPAAINAALTQAWPDWKKQSPAAQKALWDQIDALNPGLIAAGWERLRPGLPAESWPHLQLTVDGQPLRYRWQPLGGPVLIPGPNHLRQLAANAKPLSPEFHLFSPKRWTLTLDCPAAFPASPPADLRLFIAGEGDIVVSVTVLLGAQPHQMILPNIIDQAKADAALLPVAGAYHDQPSWPKTLSRTGAGLKGGLPLNLPGVRGTVTLELDIQGEGDKLQGSFRLLEPAPPKPKYPTLDDLKPQPKVLRDGLVKPVSTFPIPQILPKDGIWRTFQGNTGSGSAGDQAPMPAMVQDIAQAKLAWVSHDILPHGEGSDLRAVRAPGVSIMGGFGSPAVKGERAVLAYYRPAGSVISKFFRDRNDPRKGGALYPALTHADDVVQGFETRTGATAWKTIFPLKGANRGAMHKSGFQGSPVLEGEAVYVMGNLLKVYCLDLATGLPRWESDLGPGHQRARAVFERALAADVMMGGTGKSDASEWMNRGLQGNPRIIDGVLVVHDGQRWNAGLVGLDPTTGKRLWHVSGVGALMVPLVWEKDGRQYVIGVGDGGFTAAIDPKNGRLLWRCLDFRAGYIGASTVAGDMLIGFDSQSGHRAGFRMTLTGCTKAWELTAEQTGSAATPATAHNGRVYCLSQDTQKLQVIDPETGKLLASAPHPKGAVIEHGTLLVGAGDRLFSDNGRELQGLYVWDISRVEPRSLGLLAAPRNAGYAVAITPAIVDGRLFLRLHDRLATFDLRR